METAGTCDRQQSSSAQTTLHSPLKSLAEPCKRPSLRAVRVLQPERGDRAEGGSARQQRADPIRWIRDAETLPQKAVTREHERAERALRETRSSIAFDADPASATRRRCGTAPRLRHAFSLESRPAEQQQGLFRRAISPHAGTTGSTRRTGQPRPPRQARHRASARRRDRNCSACGRSSRARSCAA